MGRPEPHSASTGSRGGIPGALHRKTEHTVLFPGYAGQLLLHTQDTNPRDNMDPWIRHLTGVTSDDGSGATQYHSLGHSLEITLPLPAWSKPHLPRPLRTQGTQGSPGVLCHSRYRSAGTPTAAESPKARAQDTSQPCCSECVLEHETRKRGIEGWEASTDRRTALSEPQAPPPAHVTLGGALLWEETQLC